MSDVESWDPSAADLSVQHKASLGRAVGYLESMNELPEEDQTLLRPTMQVGADVWRNFCESVADEELVNWIRVLTLLERDCGGFEAGANSPVLTLISVLKARGTLPKGLFKWIRDHSENRFLPYGSLANRLNG